MEIIRKSHELTKKELYFLTKAPTVQKMSEHKNERIELSGWVLYNDLKNDGTTTEILSVVTPENEVFATNSTTFIKSFLEMQDIFDDEKIPAIRIVSAVSRAGREYLDCVYSD